MASDKYPPCELHEIINCGLCKPRPVSPVPFQRKPLFRRGAGEAKSITAKFDGLCASCGEDIDAGVDMIRLDEDLDEWVHARCHPSSLYGEERY